MRYSASNLQKMYPQDLDDDFAEECVYFHYCVQNSDSLFALREMSKLIKHKNIETTFSIFQGINSVDRSTHIYDY